MKRPGKSLDIKTIASLKPRSTPYRASDGNGLLLEVRPSGAKVWICRLTTNGKRRDMGLGGYPKISLADARKAAFEAKGQAKTGVDPIQRRLALEQQRKAELLAEKQAKENTFGKVSQKCIEALTPGWKNTRTADLWQTSLKNYAFPVLENIPVNQIDKQEVLQAVQKVWSSRPATARKVLRRIGTVLRYAAAHSLRVNDNPADLRILRHAGLPPLPGARNQPSLPWHQLPAFMKALKTKGGISPLCLRFVILTALRIGSVREARWSEISFDGVPTWTVPGIKMKNRKAKDVRPHRVPLTPAAIDVLVKAYEAVVGDPVNLKALPRLAAMQGDALIFPSRKGTVPLSDNAISKVMREMNAEKPSGDPPPWRDPDGRAAVPHGFRSTFRTWVDDTRPEDDQAAERALAHEDENKVSSAYRRSDLFDRRLPLMEAWSNYCVGRTNLATPKNRLKK